MKTLVCLILAMGAVHSSAAKVHMKPERSYVHFEYAGNIRGVSVSAGITVTLELKPYFQSLHLVAGHLRSAMDNSSPFLDARTKKKHHAFLASGLENTIHEARYLTHTITTWMEEGELMKHPLLATYDQVYGKGTKSMAAPLDHSASNYVHVDHWEDTIDFGETPTSRKRAPDFVLPPMVQEEDWLTKKETTTPASKDDFELYEDFTTHNTVLFDQAEPTRKPERYTTPPVHLKANWSDFNWERKVTSADPLEQLRSKRSIWGTLASIAKTTLKGVFTGLGIGGAMEAIFPASSSNTHTTAALEDQRRINRLEQNEIMALDKRMSKLVVGMSRSETEMEQALHADLLMNHALQVFGKTNALVQALTHLLHQKLSPELVDSAALRIAWATVKQRLNHVNAEPVFDEFLVLYGLSVGHQFNPDTLSFTIHIDIPGQVKGTEAVLYRLVPHPLKSFLNSSPTAYVIPSADASYLAVGALPNGEATYRPITNEELNNCQILHHTWVCKKLNTYSTTSAGKCLESLFALGANAPKHIGQHCVLKPATEISIYQAAHSIFSVFLPQREDIRVDCGKGETSQTWEGLVRVQLSDGCMAKVGSYQFYPTPAVKDSTLTVTKKELVLEDYVDPVVLHKWHKLNNSTLQPVARTLAQAESDFEAEILEAEESNQRSFIWWLGLATASAVGVLILGCLLYYSCPFTRWCKSRLQACRKEKEHKPKTKATLVRKGTPRRRQALREPVYGNTELTELRRLKPGRITEVDKGSISDHPDPDRISLATDV